jgi:hypothetical protein
MSRQLLELEILVTQLIAEHKKLLANIDVHAQAMKRLDLDAMDDSQSLQEASRLRISTMETKRRMIVGQLARALKIEGDPTLDKIAKYFPVRREYLLKQRAELKGLMNEILNRTSVGGKLAGAVLGHLNTVVRVLAGAVEQAGLYTKHGVPQVAGRIGVMEAVG